MNNKVSVVKCDRYSEVQNAVENAVSLIGGIGKFVKKGDNVVIKPNLVSKKKPEEAVTTNPEFLHAVIVMVEKAGGNVTIAESPGGPYNTAALKGVYSVCGVDKAIEGTNAKLNFDTSFTEVHFPEGKTIKKIPIINPILNADVIISLPKLKTHAMTSYTGAVKNLFGTIPGTYKAELHFRLNERKSFCSMLVDLHECVKPTLSIMDAVWGMEGNGPTQGSARSIGCLIAAQSAHKLDLAACGLIGLMPSEVPTLSAAIRRGLCPDSAEKLTIFGEPAAFAVPDYKTVPSQASVFFRSGGKGVFAKLADSFLFHMLTPYPKLRASACVGCKKCANICPAKAITMRGGKPDIDRKARIHCFCCQEFCPKGAMQVGRSVLAKLLEKG